VVFVAPGNAGTELEDKLINVDIGVQDISAYDGNINILFKIKTIKT
jgi:hypothetical protein